MRIILLKDSKPIEQIVVTAQSAVVGRRSDCDITIRDPAVSGHHAIISTSGDGYVIEDQNSTNGVRIDGHRVTRHRIRNGDVVKVGTHELRFMLDSEGSRSASSAAVPSTEVRTVGDTGSNAEGERVPTAEVPVATGASVGGMPRLKVISAQGEDVALQRGLTTIGQPGVQVAAISKRPRGFFIIHVDGGEDRERVPLVNGEPTGFKSRQLVHGDRIEVAGIEWEYLDPS
ncbi:MAG: FHA domain-containing protein [Pseudomonadota bacterium]